MSDAILSEDLTKHADSRKAYPRINEILGSAQGLILKNHERDLITNYFLTFKNRKAMKQLAAWVSPKIPSVLVLENHAGDDAVCFLGFSSEGVRRYILESDLGPKWDLAFNKGFRDRAVNKYGMRVDDWNDYWRIHRFDAMLICAARTLQGLQGFDSSFRKFAADSSVTIGAIEKAEVMRNLSGRPEEHFGFSDGVSQPAFFPGRGARQPDWKSNYDPGVPLTMALVPDLLQTCGGAQTYGSYMAYVRIQQHKDKFDGIVNKLAAIAHPPHGSGLTSAQYAAALIVGRRQDGKPLIGGAKDKNDFDRAGDYNGEHWPIPSHISKMNPRLEFKTGMSRPIVVRRGVTYKDSDQDYGLLFQSFQSDLEMQFETLFAGWSRRDDFPRADTGQDPILGTRDCEAAKKSPEGTPNLIPVCMSGMTTVKGGDYFYFPSIPSIAAL